jgi:hypothetical protein
MSILTSAVQVLDLDRCVQKMALVAARRSTLMVFSPRILASDLEKSFGSTTSGLVHNHIGPGRLLLWDSLSKLRGRRPNTMEILKEAYYTWGAEGDVVHSGAL